MKNRSGRPSGLPFACALIAALSAAFATTGVAGAAATAEADPHALFAREREAVGGKAWVTVAGIRSTGTLTQGGVANPFTQLLDHKNGFTRSTTRIGPLIDVSGYDGVAWDFQGGPVTEQTLPGLVADNRTQAYINRDGWWNPADPATMVDLPPTATEDGVRVTPAGGSAVDVWFDRQTGLIDRQVAHTDTGLTTTTLSDYRTVGNVIIPYVSVSVDPTNATTTVTAQTIEVLQFVNPQLLVRALPHTEASLSGNEPSSVAFRLSDDPGSIIVPLQLTSRSIPVIFDSGGANYLTPAAARSLALHAGGGMEIGGVGNSSASGGIAKLGAIALGGARLYRQQAIVGPLPYAAVHQSSTVNVAGLVGSEFLNAFRIAFDFTAKQMTLSAFGAALPAGVVLPFYSDGAHAYVRATVDGASGLFLLDTGDDGGITVFDRFVRAHNLPLRHPVRYVAVGGIGGHLAFDVYRAASFTLADVTLRNPVIDVARASAGSFASRSIAGNIGLGILSRYHVTFDFQQKVVAFTPSATAHRPFKTNTSGISLDQPDASGFVVLSLVAGGPAAQAGLALGDHIVAINGRDIAAGKLGFGDFETLLSGLKPYAVTVASGTARRNVTIHPRTLVPAVP